MPISIDPIDLIFGGTALSAAFLWWLKKTLTKKALYRRVSWIIGGSIGDQYDCAGCPAYKVRHLRECLLHKSDNAKAELPFRIKPEEYDMLDDILHSYKQDLAHAYFRNNLIFPWRFRKMDERDYLFLTLNSYLSKHETDREFCGYDMRRHIENEYYKGDGSKSTEYLTDFGAVFTKLRYLVLVYCIQTPSTNHNRLTVDYADYLREELLTGIATLLRYRP